MVASLDQQKFITILDKTASNESKRKERAAIEWHKDNIGKSYICDISAADFEKVPVDLLVKAYFNSNEYFNELEEAGLKVIDIAERINESTRVCRHKRLL